MPLYIININNQFKLNCQMIVVGYMRSNNSYFHCSPRLYQGCPQATMMDGMMKFYQLAPHRMLSSLTQLVIVALFISLSTQNTSHY